MLATSEIRLYVMGGERVCRSLRAPPIGFLFRFSKLKCLYVGRPLWVTIEVRWLLVRRVRFSVIIENARSIRGTVSARIVFISTVARAGRVVCF